MVHGTPSGSHAPPLDKLPPQFNEYAGRIRKFGISFDAKFVREVAPGGRFSDSHVKEREAQALREALPAKGHVIALSPGGRPMTTDTFANRLEQWSHPLAAFVVGGPLGLDQGFLGEAADSWSLSPLTLPHELARVVLAEQIYRAVTILRGVPYHK
jgi:23S rRNA (pseudouridine1915-N3)-methyltransferase